MGSHRHAHQASPDDPSTRNKNEKPLTLRSTWRERLVILPHPNPSPSTRHAYLAHDTSRPHPPLFFSPHSCPANTLPRALRYNPSPPITMPSSGPRPPCPIPLSPPSLPPHPPPDDNAPHHLLLRFSNAITRPLATPRPPAHPGSATSPQPSPIPHHSPPAITPSRP